MRFALLSLSLAVLTACHNACQDLCKEIASYAEDCGVTLPDGEPGTCIENSSRKNFEREQLAVCRDNAEFLRDEWTCEDVAQYFD